MLARPRSALLGALACLAGLVLTGAISHLLPAARVRDTASLSSFASLGNGGIDGMLNGIAHLADTVPYLIVLVCLVLVALHRGRRRLALLVAAVMLAAPVTTEVLKHLTAQARGGGQIVSRVADASWPSGHATGAMMIALCAVLVAPARLRPAVAAVGGAFALAVSYAILVLVWHFPSDVIGGFLVAAMWCLVAVAALRRWPDPRARPDSARRGEPVALGGLLLGGCLAAAAAAAIVAFHARGALVDHLSEHRSFVVAAALIALLAAALAAGLVHSASDE